MKIFKSSRLMTSFFSTNFYIRDRIEIGEKRLTYKRKKWLGLTSNEDSILLDRVASVRLQNKLFGFGAVVIIETQGGSKDDLRITSLRKKVANQIKAEIEPF